MKLLSYRKPFFWIAIAAILLCIAAGACFWVFHEDNAAPGAAAKGIADSEKNRSGKMFASIIKELKELPKEYSIEQQVKDGCFDIVQGEVKSDNNILVKFNNAVKSGKSAAITIVYLTDEGDPIITRVIYDGKMFYGVSDNSRDTNKGDYDDFIKFQYKYLKTFTEGKSRFALLVNDADLTVEEYRKSTLSSNSKDMIDHYFLYSIIE